MSEGRNIQVDVRFGAGGLDRFRTYAAELLSLKPDVLFGDGMPVVEALRQATRAIPIVFVNANNPVSSVGGGLVPNLSHPGGYITGPSSMAAELIPKRLQLLKEAIPQLARVTVVRDPGTPSSGYNEKLIAQLQAAAPSMSIELKFVDVQKPDDFSAAFRKMTEAYKQGVYVAECALCYSEREKLAQIAAETRIPAIT